PPIADPKAAPRPALPETAPITAPAAAPTTAPAPVPLAASVAVPPDALLASSLHSARSRSKVSLCMSRLASTVGAHPPYEAHPLIHKATTPTAISLVITRLLLVKYTRAGRSIIYSHGPGAT